MIAATYGLVRLAYGLYLPDVQADLDLDVAAAGVISGGAAAVYCAGALLGFLAAASRARAFVIASALGASIGAAGMAAAPSAGIFAVFAIASSAGAGLASPALVAVLQRNPSTETQPRAQAMVNAGTGPGLVAAGVLALILLPHWRLAWAIAAAWTILVAGLVLVSDRDRSVTTPERRSLPPVSWLLAHRRVLAAALLMGGGSAAVWNYGRTFLVDSGANETVSVVAWIALGAGGTAAIATARWLERLGPQNAWLVTVGTVAGASAALMTSGRALPTLAACVAFGWGYTAATGALIAWTSQIDRVRAPAGTALLFITLILGQGLGAGAVGAVIPAAGYTAAFLGAAAAAAVAMVPAVTSRKAAAVVSRSSS